MELAIEIFLMVCDSSPNYWLIEAVSRGIIMKYKISFIGCDDHCCCEVENESSSNSHCQSFRRLRFS